MPSGYTGVLTTVAAIASQEAQAGNFEAVAAKLRAHEVSIPIKKSYKLRDIEEISPALAIALNNALLKASKTDSVYAAMYGSAYAALASTLGVEFYQEHRQAMADGLAPHLTPEQIAQVKNLGRTVTKPYLSITAAEVEEEFNEERRRNFKNSWKAKLDEALNKLLTSEHANGVADLQSVIAEANQQA